MDENSFDNDRYVYLFDDVARAQRNVGGSWDAVRGLLGGKGANLGKMASEGLPVPYGFTVTTDACLDYLNQDCISEQVWTSVLVALRKVEARMGKKFGADVDPLLVSCRSGAKFSMPGMMDTLLNTGLTDANVVSLAAATNARFAYDSYRRLIQGFGAIVMGLDDELFEEKLKAYKAKAGYESDLDMTVDDWKAIVSIYRTILKEQTGSALPQNPLVQMKMAITAVFSSWNSERARAYRNATGIAHELGTACNIQSMVFGNMGDTSCTGVAFTRNPTTGERRMFGDFLPNAQGEDVVAGIRSCFDVHELKDHFAQAYEELLRVGDNLEQVFRNMQDIEFTVQEGKLFMLQTRDGKRTARAQVRIAKDMVREGLISKEEAVKRVQTGDVDVLLMPQLDEREMEEARNKSLMLARGVNASPGGAVGQVALDSKTAEDLHSHGKDVILVRQFTKPDDVPGFFASKGVLTAEGGATSHAAVVARQFGIPCICSASTIVIDTEKRCFTTAQGTVVREGDVISLNASAGEVFQGPISTVDANFEHEEDLLTILDWSDEIAARSYTRNNTKMRGLKVLSNGDSGADSAKARAFGAVGIGLWRTEHMFFGSESLPLMRKFILSNDSKQRAAALDDLLPIQTADFEAIYRSMSGFPVIIRLLDPPLHEFLPDRDELVRSLAKMEVSSNGLREQLEETRELLAQVENLHESNPMMGLRGVRVSILYPELIKMQVKAIIGAACNVRREGISVLPEIMIPLISTSKELEMVRQQCELYADEILEVNGMKDLSYKIGTMIETPRAAVTADEIGRNADFFSFGTNDLTQMSFGMSRDDAERRFLQDYVDKKILMKNPFQSLDEKGVGKLVHMATNDGREANPAIQIGICGEHGGDPSSIVLCHKMGLDYVSCSPYRIPAARLAAAHACLW
mmetsp:Transcript_45510/g.177012  ORF Transcript_45510/g.177012 Transcript_45510/m.177012 type:complete len:916 (-) Transcript_45510:62-2809(-)